MAYADILAQALYPNSPQNSTYRLGGQILSSIQLPQAEKPWQNALVSALQQFGGAALQGYGAYATNKANAEAAAEAIPALQSMGMTIPEAVQPYLTSENPQYQQLGLALTQGAAAQQQAQAQQQAEMQKFMMQEGYKNQLAQQSNEQKFGFDKQLKQMDVEAQTAKAAREGVGNPLQIEKGLREEISSSPEFKQFSLNSNYMKAMEAAAQRDDRASDISLISNIAKMRDPTSVVREGEFKLSTDTASWLDQQFGNLRSAVTGQSRLAPETRAKLLNAARDYYDSSRQQYEAIAAPRVDLAKRYGVDPNNILMVPYQQPKSYDTVNASVKEVTSSPTPSSTGQYVPSPSGGVMQMTPEARAAIDQYKAQLKAGLIK